jgi:hypothetical protein
MDERDVEQLQAAASYARSRYDLYRQKAYSLRPTSPARLMELKRASEAAEERLSRALRTLDRQPPAATRQPTGASRRAPD